MKLALTLDRDRMAQRLRRFAARAGIAMPRRSLARITLEEKILPFYAKRDDLGRVLFVGCEYFTHHYWKLFRGKEYWTIDVDPAMRAFGARKRHICDSLENLDRHFPAGYFDLVLCNGVYGWGLNTKEQCEVGFQRCFDHLRKGGELMVGWNDVARHVFVPLEEISSLGGFRQQSNNPFSTWRYRTEAANHHVFDFYIK